MILRVFLIHFSLDSNLILIHYRKWSEKRDEKLRGSKKAPYFIDPPNCIKTLESKMDQKHFLETLQWIKNFGIWHLKFYIFWVWVYLGHGQAVFSQILFELQSNENIINKLKSDKINPELATVWFLEFRKIQNFKGRLVR